MLSTKSAFIVVISLVGQLQAAEAFSSPFASLTKNIASAPVTPSKIDRTVNPQWLDALKYDGEPSFNVLQKTMEFANSKTYDEYGKYLADDYVFRGPIIGPITAEDVKKTQQGFKITDAYPDLETRPFGFTVDPDNPYRCYFMERWEGTNTGSVQLGPITLPPTNQQVQLPTHIMSINWTPEGKIKYACLSSPLDRFEGTTQGAGAIFGLLVGAGLGSQTVAPGDLMLRIQQRFFGAIGLGKSWSAEQDIPDWWKSKARGADPNDL